MKKWFKIVVALAVFAPTSVLAGGSGIHVHSQAQSTQRQFIYDSGGKTVGFYYGSSATRGYFNGSEQGMVTHPTGDFHPYGAPLPKIKVDPNSTGWTPLWMREDSSDFEK